ncbi:MAG: hypothetical protein P4L67_02330 [Candidatus Pacebacteria bacterium]|nr:hypothetical protein [Candidatus Paceibacterota bacterium]
MKTSQASSVSKSTERLFNSKKRTAEKLEAKVTEQIKREQQSLRVKPGLSQGSKKLLQSKKYLPIYSKERLQQIDSAKKQKIEKLRQEMAQKKKQTEEEELANSVQVYKGSEITNVELCFDPRSIRSVVYESSGKKDKTRETTEDEEVKTCCSFHPSTDKNSTALFTKRNVNSKGVVQRLIDYGKFQKKTIEQLAEDSRPQFKPQKYSEISRKNSHGKGRNKAWGFQTKEEVVQSQFMDAEEEQKKEATLRPTEKREDSKQPQQQQEGNDPKLFNMDDLKQLMNRPHSVMNEGRSETPSLGGKEAAPSAKSSVIAKYLI